MKTLAIIYGSSSGNTKEVAEKISGLIPGSVLHNVDNFKISDLENYDNLILGTSTWGLGDLQDDWEGFLPELKKANLEGKTIALFGLGDSSSYSDTFVDGMWILYETIKAKGCTVIGSVSTNGYTYDASRADNGAQFCGLALDEDNESQLTDTRIADWVREISGRFQ